MTRRTNQSANKTVRHTFRLTEQENLELKKQAEQAGYRENLSKYIVKRIFSPAKNESNVPQINQEYLTKLCDFYFQFQKVGNNYNQVVKAIYTRYTDATIIKLLKLIVSYTRQLKVLSKRIIELTEQLKDQWLR